MKKVLYIGSTIGNRNSAMRLHAVNTAHILRMISYETTFVCYGNVTEKTDYEDDFEFHYAEMPHDMIRSYIEKLTNVSLWNTFKKMASKIKPDIVILYGVEPELRVIRYCKKNRILCFLEKVDWFERRDRKSFFNKIVFQNKVDLCYRKIDFMADGIISISPYLQNYFENNGMRTVFIPPTFDKLYYPHAYCREPNQVTSIVYAGSLGGGKDSILPAIQAVMSINSDDVKISFHLIGITEAEVAAVIPGYSQGKNGIVTYGRISHDEVIKTLYRCDFSLLLRENRRYAKAGFSTKFAESMFCGVPVIATAVGGADSLIKSGENGFLIQDNSVDSLSRIFRLLLSLNNEEIQKIKDNAFSMGAVFFLCESYKDKLSAFVSNVARTCR